MEYDRVYDTNNFLPQPTQSVGRFKGTIPYRRRRLYWNSSLDNFMPLRRWGIAVSYFPFFVALWRRFNPTVYG